MLLAISYQPSLFNGKVSQKERWFGIADTEWRKSTKIFRKVRGNITRKDFPIDIKRERHIRFGELPIDNALKFFIKRFQVFVSNRSARRLSMSAKFFQKFRAFSNCFNNACLLYTSRCV